jgi:hypothetical protein
MFYGNAMHYPDRLAVARHDFETVTIDLAEDYDRYEQILARHVIPLTRPLVVEELEEVRQRFEGRRSGVGSQIGGLQPRLASHAFLRAQPGAGGARARAGPAHRRGELNLPVHARPCSRNTSG